MCYEGWAGLGWAGRERGTRARCGEHLDGMRTDKYLVIALLAWPLQMPVLQQLEHELTKRQDFLTGSDIEISSHHVKTIGLGNGE